MIYSTKGLENFSSPKQGEINEIHSFNDLPHIENDNAVLDGRNKEYTDILIAYSDYIKQNLNKKLKYQIPIIICFFVLLFAIIIFSFVIIGVTIYLKLDYIRAISYIIPAAVSLVSAIIIIPSKITEYVFNTNETSQVSEVIKNIQEYDISVREDLYKNKKKL